MKTLREQMIEAGYGRWVSYIESEVLRTDDEAKNVFDTALIKARINYLKVSCKIKGRTYPCTDIKFEII